MDDTGTEQWRRRFWVKARLAKLGQASGPVKFRREASPRFTLPPFGAENAVARVPSELTAERKFLADL